MRATSKCMTTGLILIGQHSVNEIRRASNGGLCFCKVSADLQKPGAFGPSAPQPALLSDDGRRHHRREPPWSRFRPSRSGCRELWTQRSRIEVPFLLHCIRWQPARAGTSRMTRVFVLLACLHSIIKLMCLTFVHSYIRIYLNSRINRYVTDLFCGFTVPVRVGGID